MAKMSIVRTSQPTLRVYLRRSKADEGHQQFSLDVQREGCRRFAVDDLPRRDLTVSWPNRVEYVDDDRAGDDFLGRTELRRLRNDVQPGDVVLCRDQSRLGRDAIEVTLAIRELVRDRGARLLYYTTGQEVPFANAIDAATTFIGGVGHQMELEAIRSRTKEALRARVRAGRIAGGRCFGYALKRDADGSGRAFTTAIVDEAEAAVVRQIFAWYIEGLGLKRIAMRLNEGGVRSPVAGRRGTNSWSPSCVREILRRERYRGVYRHGRIHRVRRGGRRLTIAAPPEQIITREIPEWRIIEDSIWFAAQALTTDRRREVRAPGPAAKYPLSGIAKCSTCGGAIGVTRTTRGTDRRVPAYTCTFHHTRGKAVCPVTLHQPMDIVHEALTDYLRNTVLVPSVVDVVLDSIRTEVETLVSSSARDTAVLETELAEVRAEQKRLARAVATAGDDIPELAAELRLRHERIRRLEADIASARRTPATVADLLARAEESAHQKLADLRKALEGDLPTLRGAFRGLFPEGLAFRPAEGTTRRVWAISGMAHLDSLKLVSDPSGIRNGTRTEPFRRFAKSSREVESSAGVR
jgi:site-specific DNA recombinase